jgi:hypothetical protein
MPPGSNYRGRKPFLDKIVAGLTKEAVCHAAYALLPETLLIVCSTAGSGAFLYLRSPLTMETS